MRMNSGETTDGIETTDGSTKKRVMRAEHLIAIKLKVRRLKDLAHVHAILQRAKIDHGYLQGILERHGLMDKWQEFQGETKKK